MHIRIMRKWVSLFFEINYSDFDEYYDRIRVRLESLTWLGQD